MISKITEKILICIHCGVDLETHDDLGCDYIVHINKNSMKYDYKNKMFLKYGKRFLLNQVQNNNAEIIYRKDAFNSLAIPGNNNSRNIFIKSRVENHFSESNVFYLLDVGCGPQNIPEYLYGLENKLFLFGIDPIPNSNYTGFKIDGCAEFLPIKDNTFDFIIFGGSLDQTVDAEKSISEAIRVLKSDGRVLVKLNDDGGRLNQYKKTIINLKRQMLSIFSRINHGNIYIVDGDYTCLYRPFGAIDPFHKSLLSYYRLKKYFNISGFFEVNNTLLDSCRIIEFKSKE